MADANSQGCDNDAVGDIMITEHMKYELRPTGEMWIVHLFLYSQSAL